MSRRAARHPDPIVYRITPADPHAHLFSVVLSIADPAPEGQRVALPAWIPGSYMVREFARHIVTLSARDDRGRLRIDKLDKHTWRAAPAVGALVIEYLVYAWDLSVRAAHLDATHAFFNATSLCLRVQGREAHACTVDLEPPPASVARDWRVATTLPEAGARRGGFGRYRAADYDALADHPVEMGRFVSARFDRAARPRLPRRPRARRARSRAGVRGAMRALRAAHAARAVRSLPVPHHRGR